MSDQNDYKLEGRLTAMREMVLILMETEIQRNPTSSLMDKLERLLDAPDHQEDPGAITIEATAPQSAARREIETVLHAVKGRVHSGHI